MTGFVHIFVPAYGESPYLEECLESIKTHTDETVLCTVLDDCSPNANIRSSVEKFGNRFSYVRNDRNLGLARNFQKAFDLSESTYTLIVGSDDVLLPGYVDQLKEAAQKFPTACLFQPQVSVIDENSQTFNAFPDLIKKFINPGKRNLKEYEASVILRRLLIGDFFYFPSIAWKAEVVRSYQLNPHLKTAVDLDLIARLAMENHTFVIGGQTVFSYRRHSKSVSMELGMSYERSKEEIEVHRQISRILRSNGNLGAAILARVAITVRLNAVYSAIRNPGAGSKIVREAFKI
jgi:glycosyltransferase involved in cell wall biosynthesis